LERFTLTLLKFDIYGFVGRLTFRTVVYSGLHDYDFNL